MAQVELAHVPRLVGRRIGDNHAVLERGLVKYVHFGGRVHPPRHPDPVGLIVARMLRHHRSTRALGALAEKDLRVVRTDAAEIGIGVAVGPGEPDAPAKLLEPGDALRHARNVEDGSDAVYMHQSRSSSGQRRAVMSRASAPSARAKCATRSSVTGAETSRL